MNWDRVAENAFIQKSAVARVNVKRFTNFTRLWRRLCLQRDGYRCLLCGASTNLEVHHIVRWVDAPLLRLKKENGATLCRVCHQKWHGPQGNIFPREIVEQLLAEIKKKKVRVLCNSNLVRTAINLF